MGGYSHCGALWAAAVALVFAHAPAGAKTPRPSVLVIVIDTLRADHVGAYADERGLTPNLDALAQRSQVFENAFATSSWTRPSVASLLTGRYPTSLSVEGRADALGEAIPFLPELLHGASFQTFGVITNANTGGDFGFARGFDRFIVPELERGYPSEERRIRVAEGVTATALELVDGRERDRPFLLFAHYVDPHEPYLPHPGLLNEPEPPGRFNGSAAALLELDSTPPDEITANDRARIAHLYAGEVKYCDHWIGELMTGLRERGLLEGMWIVVTSDHGEGLWNHGHRAHGHDLYEESLRVPLIVGDPRRRPGDPPRIEALVSGVDLLPTLARALDLPPDPGVQGSDLTPLLRGEAQASLRNASYAELNLDGRSFHGLRQGSWKLVMRRKGVDAMEPRVQLFDLSSDAAERTNVAASRSERRVQLGDALERWASGLAGDRAEASHVATEALTPAARASLEALGYLSGVPARSPELSSLLDFSDPDHPQRQIVHGFWQVEDGWRWMAPSAAVVLNRTQGQRGWWLKGWVDLAAHHDEPLAIEVRVDGGPGQVHRIDDTGGFTLEGKLANSSSSEVRLEFACDRAFVPARTAGNDARSLCAVVNLVGLR